MGRKFLINKVKLLNHKWVIADFSDGTDWGEIWSLYSISGEEVRLVFSIKFSTSPTKGSPFNQAIKSENYLDLFHALQGIPYNRPQVFCFSFELIDAFSSPFTGNVGSSVPWLLKQRNCSNHLLHK